MQTENVILNKDIKRKKKYKLSLGNSVLWILGFKREI